MLQKKNKAIEIVKGKHMDYSGKLYWISDVEPPKNIPKSFYFNIDNVFNSPFRISSTTASTRILDLSTWAKHGSTSPNLRSS
jgi:hypothetical protein